MTSGSRAMLVLDVGRKQGRKGSHDRRRVLYAGTETLRKAVVGLANIVTIRSVTDPEYASVFVCIDSHIGDNSRITVPQRLLTTHTVPDVGKDICRHPAKFHRPDLQDWSGRAEMWEVSGRAFATSREVSVRVTETDLSWTRRRKADESGSTRWRCVHEWGVRVGTSNDRTRNG